LDKRKNDKEILYIFTVALLITASLETNLTSGATYNPYMVKAASMPTMVDPSLAANETFLVDEWRREIVVDAWGGLSANDYYSISNNNQSEGIYRITFLLPANASDISLQDAYGGYSKTAIVVSAQEEYTQVDVALKETLKLGERNEFLVTYRLPSSRYITKSSWRDYTLKLNLAKPENWLVRNFSLIISLPEGAELKSFSGTGYKTEMQGLSVKIILTEHDLVEFHNPYITLEYRYFILWAAFRPMIWTAAVALVGAAFFFIKRFMHPPAAVTPVSLSILREFVESYEEKRRLSMRIESLQRQFRRGRISRRRLRLRRKPLDQRLAALNKRLAELKDEIIATARQYEEILRDLETAEAEIEALNVDIERVEARFRRGEISADVRRRLLDEYGRIKERAENTILKILIRLREESM